MLFYPLKQFGKLREVIDLKLVLQKLDPMLFYNFVLQNYGDDRITLTTCHPRFSAKQRLIVVGELEKVEVFG